MSFIKAHYEKLILTALLALFLAMFSVYVLGTTVFNEMETSPANEILEQSILDRYTPLKLEDEKYDAGKIMAGSISEWKANPKQGDMDLLVPRVLIRCPHGRHLIPFSDLETGKMKCSYCGGNLKILVPDGNVTVVRQVDTDNDGIPDEIEKRYNLNPKDPQDAAQDLDKDGYTNIEEFNARTELNNPASHPSYAERLTLKEVRQNYLGIQLRTFSYASQTNPKEKWKIRIRIRKKSGKKLIFSDYSVAIGGKPFEVFNTDMTKVMYTVKDIREKWDKDAKGKPVNASSVELVRMSDSTVITLERGKEAVDPKRTLIFYFDVPFVEKHEIICPINGTFTLGSTANGKDTFKVLSVDENEGKPTAKIQDTKNKRIFVIQPYTGPSDPQMMGPEAESGRGRPGRAERPPRQKRGAGLPEF